MKWMIYRIISTRAFSVPRRILREFVMGYLDSQGLQKMQLSKPSQLLEEIRGTAELLLTDQEAEWVFSLAKQCSKNSDSSELAEVGVYQGGSAKLICAAKGNKPLHLFDTFEGHPEVGGIDKPTYHTGQFKVSFRSVRESLAGYENVHFWKGRFPETSGAVLNRKFSFVHLDVDLYQSTLDCLEFFYPRMVQGGMILTHDYAEALGVRRAFAEFLDDKPERITVITPNQGLLVKR